MTDYDYKIAKPGVIGKRLVFVASAVLAWVYTPWPVAVVISMPVWAIAFMCIFCRFGFVRKPKP